MVTNRRILHSAVLTFVFCIPFLSLSFDACADSTLSAEELKVLYKNLSGVTERDGKLFNGCDEPLKPETKIIDLNGDGQPEVFVLSHSGICFGMYGANMTLFMKNKNGQWVRNFDFATPGYTILKKKNKGYPDIEIAGRGSCSPVWRWNGKAYDIYKRCPT